jgi:hypothetical protein
LIVGTADEGIVAAATVEAVVAVPAFQDIVARRPPPMVSAVA